MRVLCSISWDKEKAKTLGREGDYFLHLDPGAKDARDLQSIVAKANELVGGLLEQVGKIAKENKPEEVIFVVGTGNPILDYFIISVIVGLIGAALQQGRLDFDYKVYSPIYDYRRENGKLKRKFVGWASFSSKELVEAADDAQKRLRNT